MKVASALALGLMLVFLIPRAKQMMANSPAAEAGDWTAAIFPIAVVILFVVLLIVFV